MQTDNLYALLPEYQRQMRALVGQLTEQGRYDDQTKVIIELLKADKTDDALFEVLQLRSNLKLFLESTRKLFDELLDAEGQALLKYISLRQQTFEAIQEIASENGRRIVADDAMRRLNEMNGYFDSAIAYLDFEPEKKTE